MWRSLRFRLLAGGALWIALALLLAGLYIVQSFTNSIEAERRDDLEASLDRIVAAIDPATTPLKVADPLTDPRYDTPLSGMYWQIDDLDTGERLRSRSLWDGELPRSERDGDDQGVLSQITGPEGNPVIVLTRRIEMESAGGARRFNVAVAEDRSRDDDPIGRFGDELKVALVVLGLALFLAAILQVYFGLSPLVVLGRQINSIRRGDAERLPADTGPELQPVTTQINDLLEAQDASIAFARERAADLAHGLKTPLAVLSATSERLLAGGDAKNADVLALLADQMNQRIEYQLRIARLRYRTRARGVTASVNEAVLRSVAVLRLSHEGERLNWAVNLDRDLLVDADSHDLMELVGILLENATQWAAERVQITCTRKGQDAELVVEDDGRGLSDEQISRLGVRGLRLDESASGNGLGLSIAFEIVGLNRGSILVDRGRLGGLRSIVLLPLVHP